MNKIFAFTDKIIEKLIKNKKLNALLKEKEAAQAGLDALYERWEQLSEEAEG